MKLDFDCPIQYSVFWFRFFFFFTKKLQPRYKIKVPCSLNPPTCFTGCPPYKNAGYIHHSLKKSVTHISVMAPFLKDLNHFKSSFWTTVSYACIRLTGFTYKHKTESWKVHQGLSGPTPGTDTSHPPNPPVATMTKEEGEKIKQTQDS